MNTKVFNLLKEKKTPHKLFDFLIEKYDLGSDYKLAKELGTSASSICKIRAGKPVTATYILKVHERWDMPIKEIKELL